MGLLVDTDSMYIKDHSSARFTGVKMGSIYAGRFVHALSLNKLELLEKAFCVVSASGRIEYFGTENPSPSYPNYVYRIIPKTEFMIPGFVDTHTHAPQYSNIGVGLQYELLEWLDKVTFPTESSFSVDETDERVSTLYQGMVEEYLRNGTTCCCYFGSIQVPANLILAKAAISTGQRAFIGKVCMDCQSPDFYCESTEQSLTDTKDFVEKCCQLESDLVKPIVTPRFAITCTNELMKGLSELAKEKDLNIQTHLSENKGEIAFVKELFPRSKNYTDVYDSTGLLTEKTVLAHCIYLSEEEQNVIKERGSAISHCPNSNFSLSSGIMPLRSYLEKGLKVGLGTDVSGGYSVSILDTIRQSVLASKALQFQDPSSKAITLDEAFFLATLGGAEALALDKVIGNFEVGKSFDALHISQRKPLDDLRSSFERFLFCGDDRDINRVYVNGFKAIDNAHTPIMNR